MIAVVHSINTFMADYVVHVRLCGKPVNVFHIYMMTNLIILSQIYHVVASVVAASVAGAAIHHSPESVFIMP